MKAYVPQLTASESELRLPADVLDAFRVAGVVPADEALPGELTERTTGIRRQRRLRPELGPTEVDATHAQLVRDGDVLRWELDSDPVSTRVSRRASRRGAVDLARTVIEQFKLVPAHGSAVFKMLSDLDDKLNPDGGLRELRGSVLGPTGATPIQSGSVLVIIHGTFSAANTIVSHLNATDAGRRFLTQAQAQYGQVLAFEHPTLSVGPLLNAVELARAFNGSRASIDIVCHSRGGLVARWWLEVLDPQRLRQTRVVFVGSPLQGSSLAAPDRLRSALDLLTNAAAAIGNAGQFAAIAVPWVGAIGGILRVLAAGTGAVSRTPVLDAALAMIPGLSAQSRTINNFELQSLGRRTDVPSGYHFVVSNFEPVIGNGGPWQFLHYFRRLPESLIDAGADTVFTGMNDLVVDTPSMTEMRCDLRELQPGQVSTALVATARDRLWDFGTSKLVHHLNYFEQPETVAFITKAFRLATEPPRAGRRTRRRSNQRKATASGKTRRRTGFR